MYDVEGQELAAGDVVLCVHRGIAPAYQVYLEQGIIRDIEADIAHVLDMTLTYARRFTGNQIVLRTSVYRGQHASFIAELYKTLNT